MIVVDVNVLAYLLFDKGEKGEVVRALLLRDPVWIMPTFWRHEFLNVLALQMKYMNLNCEGAHHLFVMAENRVGSEERHINANLVLKTAESYGLSAYDAQYVALAEALDMKLYTYDKQILRSCPNVAVKPQ